MQKGQQNQKKLDQKLIWYFGCLRDPQTHPGAKMTPKMACESQIWPRCTPRGITSLFRTKELIFETDRSKLSHFTRNYPHVYFSYMGCEIWDRGHQAASPSPLPALQEISNMCCWSRLSPAHPWLMALDECSTMVPKLSGNTAYNSPVFERLRRTGDLVKDEACSWVIIFNVIQTDSE